MNDDKPEIPVQPDKPEIKPRIEPPVKIWPEKIPEIIPAKDPDGPKLPNEIPPAVK